MLLSEWVRREGNGAIRRLSEASGISYMTCWSAARRNHRVKYETAKKISAATDGAVSIPELCEGEEASP